jgi:hypothetical protein
MQIGKSNQSKGDEDSSNAPRGGRPGLIRKPTNCSSPTVTAIIVSSCSMRIPVRSSAWARSAKPAGVDNCAIIGPKSFPEGEGPPDYNVVHAIRVARWMVYVADRENRRLQMFTPDGKFVKQLYRTDMPFARDRLFPRPGAGVSRTSAAAGIVVVDRKTLDAVE